MLPAPASAAKAVEMLDLLIEFFDGGTRWQQSVDCRHPGGREHNDAGERRCLLGAMYYLRERHEIVGDATRYYLQKAMPYRDFSLRDYNDYVCRKYNDLLQLMLSARDLAQADNTTAAPSYKLAA